MWLRVYASLEEEVKLCLGVWQGLHQGNDPRSVLEHKEESLSWEVEVLGKLSFTELPLHVTLWYYGNIFMTILLPEP